MERDVIIRELGEEEPYPLALFCLADPDERVIETYIERSRIYVLEYREELAGVYGLLATRPLNGGDREYCRL